MIIETNTPKTTIEIAAAALKEVYAAWEEQGATDVAEIELPASDLEYITERAGRLLTREEWQEIGLAGWIGSAHVAEDEKRRAALDYAFAYQAASFATGDDY